MKFFTVAWSNEVKNNRFLENLFTQRLWVEIEFWDKITLENVLRVTVSVKYFNVS